MHAAAMSCVQWLWRGKYATSIFPDHTDGKQFQLCHPDSHHGRGRKDASFEWSIPSKNLRLTGRSVVCYFEQKGTYEVTLTSEWNSQKGSITKSITVENDSYYYQQGEHLWWNDEFTSHTLDKMAWNYDIGTEGWGNSEKQNYTSSSETPLSETGN